MSEDSCLLTVDGFSLLGYVTKLCQLILTRSRVHSFSAKWNSYLVITRSRDDWST